MLARLPRCRGNCSAGLEDDPRLYWLYMEFIWETGDSVKSQHFKVVSPFARPARLTPERSSVRT